MYLDRRLSRFVDRRSAVFAAVLCVGIGHASAADRSWDNPAGGTFQTAVNWADDIAPTALDEASFNIGNAAYAVTLNGSPSTIRTRVGDAVTLNLNGNTYTTTNPGVVSGFTFYSLDVGRTVGQPANLAVKNGTLTTVAAAAGALTGTIGTITIDPDVTWTASDYLTAGDQGAGTIAIQGRVTLNGIATGGGGLRVGRNAGGAGTLLISGASGSLTVNATNSGSGVQIAPTGTGYVKVSAGGGFYSRDGCFFGSVGGAGTIDVVGTGSRWINGGDADIGFNGFGTINVANGGSLSFNNAKEVSLGTGNTLNSTGLLQISDAGSGASVGRLYVSEKTFGTLSVLNGGTLLTNSTVLSAPSAVIAYGTLAVGTATVSGANSNWTQNSTLTVGYFGHGTLNVAAGGSVLANSVTVGDFNLLAAGNVSVDGANSSLTAVTGIYVGGSATMTGGTGAVSVANGGAINAGSILKVWNTGTFTYANGGTISSPRIDVVGGGRFNLTASGTKVLRTNELNVDTSSRLDVTNNALVVDYSGSSPVADIRAKIANAYTAGLWTGNGITSSTAAGNALALSQHPTAVGYAEASDLFGTAGGAFAGQSVDGTAVVARYVYSGDANLDGTIDTRDFARLIAGFGQTARWAGGDFNYSGVVDSTDFSIFVSNYGLTLVSPSTDALPAAAVTGSLVPEPAALGLFLAGVGLLKCRRR